MESFLDNFKDCKYILYSIIDNKYIPVYYEGTIPELDVFLLNDDKIISLRYTSKSLYKLSTILSFSNNWYVISNYHKYINNIYNDDDYELLILLDFVNINIEMICNQYFLSNLIFSNYFYYNKLKEENFTLFKKIYFNFTDQNIDQQSYMFVNTLIDNLPNDYIHDIYWFNGSPQITIYFKSKERNERNEGNEGNEGNGRGKKYIVFKKGSYSNKYIMFKITYKKIGRASCRERV